MSSDCTDNVAVSSLARLDGCVLFFVGKYLDVRSHIDYSTQPIYLHMSIMLTSRALKREKHSRSLLPSARSVIRAGKAMVQTPVASNVGVRYIALDLSGDAKELDVR